MIFLSLRGFFREIFFSEKISYLNVFRLTRYYYPKSIPILGFSKQEAYTANIDISVDKDIFFRHFKKNTRYEINRAKREGVIFAIEKNLDFFYNYYNEFAKSKGLELLRYETLLKYKEHMLITKAIKGNIVLSMHVHLYNKEIAILLYSASQFRNIEENKMRNLIGYSNRFLHYEEMLYFKKLGCLIYDFGGYAYNTDNEIEQRINKFKDSFSCIPKKRYIYTSWTLNSLIFIKTIVNKIGLKTQKL